MKELTFDNALEIISMFGDEVILDVDMPEASFIRYAEALLLHNGNTIMGIIGMMEKDIADLEEAVQELQEELACSYSGYTEESR